MDSKRQIPFRIGHGFDSHRLVAGRKLILGGVEIKHDRGLDGHSDADVLIHAIMDALLGAAGLGDIGQHFPPTDERFRDADSGQLLEQVVRLVQQAGFDLIGNIDCVIMAERPRLADYLLAMKDNLARLLGIDATCVGLKATTGEKMGWVGREEGMAASVVCLIGSNE